MDIYQPDRKRGRARERQEARNRRREPMVKPLDPKQHDTGSTPLPGASAPHLSPPPPRQNDASSDAETAPPSSSRRTRRVSRDTTLQDSPPIAARTTTHTTVRVAAKTAVNAARAIENVEWSRMQQDATRRAQRAALVARDGVWYARNNPRILFGIVGLLAAAFCFFILFHVAGNRIFPNVRTAGITLGGMTTEEAAAAVQRHWSQDVEIELVDGDRAWTVSTAQLGLRIDALRTVEAMRAVGMSGIPFGYNVYPTLDMDLLTTQNTLLDISEDAQIQPLNAGYHWEGELLLGTEGTDGRFLDVSATLDALSDNLELVSDTRRLELVMTSVAPDFRDPEPYLDQVRALSAQTFRMSGYDPFTNETFTWSTDRETFTSWLEAGANSLTLREQAFAPFIQAQTQVLQQEDPLRYLEPTETINSLRSAIQNGQPIVNFRVRYQPTTYRIVSGDTGYYIARKTGLPFNLIQQANPGRDWEDMLSPGEVINLPTRDETLPVPLTPHKRIVINISSQYLVAFEDDQVVFDWAISTGMNTAPTYPGVFQILSHVDLATGSSFELCTADTCGTWDMYWFMGIYEVFPGLVNGFHGAVVLPNGTYLGGGNVGRPFTYGCVMSENANAEMLYRWADEGTIVEIISGEYAPQSQLAQAVWDGTWSNLPRRSSQSVWDISNIGL